MMDAMISSTAIFACADIEATIAHYKDVLGFESTWTWGEPPNFGGASLGGVSLMFCLQPDLAAKVRGHQHWFKVEDADDLYAAHRSRGANVASEIADTPWNAREYVVEDLNGYHLRFAGPPKGTGALSKPFPEGVAIRREFPSAEEFERVRQAAFGGQEAFPDKASELLARTWACVTARASSGELIGVTRVMHDAPGWFSVWDVAVLPDWQSQRIGSKLMEEAQAMVREDSPGAFVFLFTFKHGFYEKLGFTKETVTLRRV
jgi:ribosomal protein S18 acetylase RimI-like enzyme